jgi:hypothetical protein
MRFVVANFRDYQALLGRDRLRRGRQYLSQTQLLRVLRHPQPITLGAESPSLEPLELGLQGLHGRRQRLRQGDRL